MLCFVYFPANVLTVRLLHRSPILHFLRQHTGLCPLIKLELQSLLGFPTGKNTAACTPKFDPCLLRVCKVTQLQTSSSAPIPIQASWNGRLFSLSLFPDHIPRCFPCCLGKQEPIHKDVPKCTGSLKPSVYARHYPVNQCTETRTG